MTSMWPVLFKVRNLEVTVFVVAMAVMFWVVSFLVWRRMNRDYEEEKIFMLLVVMMVAGIVSSYVWSWVIYREWGTSLYGAILGVVAGLWLWCKSNNWNFWEWADVVGGIFLPMMAVGGLAWGPAGLTRFAGAVLLGLVAVGLTDNYRKFRWYKSGRVGFGALVSAGAVCLLELIVAFVETGAVYFGGLTVRQWVAAVFLTVCLVLIYLRSGRKASEDLQSLWQRIKKSKS